MSLQDNDLEVSQSINNSSDKVSSNSQNQKDNVKLKIMRKYGVSSEDAEKILFIIENKQKSKVTKGDIDNPNNIKNLSSNDNNKKSETTFEKYEKKISKESFKHNEKVVNQEGDILNNELKKGINNQTDVKYDADVNHDLKDNSESDKLYSNKDENVDSLLEDIIPNYNQQISIEVNHVDLTFEVQNEKIDTLKESFIRTFKRQKSNKFRVHALNDISFTVYKGEKVGIIGYNGAGKSTLLNVISGIYTPDKGNVITYGKISPLLALGAGFDANFSGRKNIMLNGAILGYDKEYLESKMDEIIEFSELGEFIDIPIKNYSSGMLAKLGFSIGAVVNPDILIIDEILGVGDVNFAKKSRDKIKSLMDGGTTVLLVSHSIPQIREICDKAIWIDNGCVRLIGEVNNVCDKYLKDAEKASNEQLANIQFK